MGTKGKLTYTVADESGDIDPGQTYVILVPAGGTVDGPSAVQMSDADSNGTYLVDLEDDGIGKGLYDIYVAGIKEIDSFIVITKDLLDDIDAFSASISDHESGIISLNSSMATVTGDIIDLEGSVNDLQTDMANATGDITSITSGIATITANIVDLEGSVDSLQGTVNTLETHVADSSDPHGSSLTQTQLICSDLRGLAGDPKVKLQGQDGANDIEVVIENYGSPSGYVADLFLKNGALKFNNGNLQFSESSDNLYLDIKKATDSIFYIHNSQADKECNMIIDGLISGDVEEVVSARAGYANLNNRLNAMSAPDDVIANLFMNMSEFEGIQDTGGIGTINYINCQYITLPYKLVIDRIRVYCTTLHASATYCFGIYNHLGNRQCTTGAVQLNSTGILSFSFGSTITLHPGVYYIAFTASTTTGQMYGYMADYLLNQRYGGIPTVGGSTLPSKIVTADINTGAYLIPYICLDLTNIS